MRGVDFLDVEKTLRGYDGEAFLRTRIGRLYYGAFLETRRYCELRLGYSRLRMAREHQAIANLLRGIDPVLADALSELRQSRNVADYDDDASLSEIQVRAEDAVSLAAAIMSRLETLNRHS